MEFGLSDEEIGRLTMREYYALWDALRAKEKRQHTVAVHQMGELIAMTGNSGNLRFEQPLRREMFIPAMWTQTSKPEEREEEDLDTQLRRAMEKATSYQAGQAARGLLRPPR